MCVCVCVWGGGGSMSVAEKESRKRQCTGKGRLSLAPFGKSPNAQRGSGSQGEKQRTSLPPPLLLPLLHPPPPSPAVPITLCFCVGFFLFFFFFLLLTCACVCFLLRVDLSFSHRIVQADIMNMCLQICLWIRFLFCSRVHVRFHVQVFCNDTMIVVRRSSCKCTSGLLSFLLSVRQQLRGFTSTVRGQKGGKRTEQREDRLLGKSSCVVIILSDHWKPAVP